MLVVDTEFFNCIMLAKVVYDDINSRIIAQCSVVIVAGNTALLVLH